VSGEGCGQLVTFERTLQYVSLCMYLSSELTAIHMCNFGTASCPAVASKLCAEASTYLQLPRPPCTQMHTLEPTPIPSAPTRIRFPAPPHPLLLHMCCCCAATAWSQLGTKPYLVVSSGPHKGKCVDIKRPLFKGTPAMGIYPCVFPKPTARSTSCTNCTIPWQVNSRGQLFWKGTGSCLTNRDTVPVLTSCASSAASVQRQTWRWRGSNGLQSVAPGKTPAGSCLGAASGSGTPNLLLVECGNPQQLKLTLSAGA
jgi:hypothetical protein